MDIPWGFLSGLVWKVLSIIKPKPRVAIRAEFLFEDGGGNSNVGGTAWNLWKDMYVKLCVTNTGGATTIEEASISIRDSGHEVLRFSPWKVLEYINYKDLSRSPELNKALIGARIETNDCWGPHIVLFTTQRIINGNDARLPGGDPFLTIAVVGQRAKPLRI